MASICEKRKRRLQKEIHNLWKNIDQQTNGQAFMAGENWDSSRIDKFHIVLKPNDGPYRGGSFEFSIKLDENYPSTKPPFVYCETDIYHPNITSDKELRDFDDIYGEFDLSRDKTNVCLNLLTEGLWNPSFGLESIVLGLLFLLHHPNYDDPLAIEFDGISEKERGENIRKYMAGEEIDGTVYQTDFVVRDGKLISSNSAQHKCTGSENGCSECLDSQDSGYGSQVSQSSEDSHQDPHKVCCKNDTNTTSREDQALSKSFTEPGIMELNVSKNTPSIEEQETQSTSSSQSEESDKDFDGISEEERVENIRKYMAGEEIDGTVHQTDFVVRDGKLISSNSAQHKDTGSENGCSECLDSQDSGYGTQDSQSSEDNHLDLHEVCCKHDTNTSSIEDQALSKKITEAGTVELNVSKNPHSIEEQEIQSTSSTKSEESDEEFDGCAHTRMVKFNESYVLFGGNDIDAEDFVNFKSLGFGNSERFQRTIQSH